MDSSVAITIVVCSSTTSIVAIITYACVVYGRADNQYRLNELQAKFDNEVLRQEAIRDNNGRRL